MTGIMKSLVNDTPLYRREVVVIHGHILLTAPSKTTVVDDDVRGILYTNSTSFDETPLFIGSIRFPLVTRQIQRTQTGAEVTDNDIVRATEVQFSATQEDTLTGCRLPGNRHILQFGTDSSL